MENREWYNLQGRAVTADLPNMAGVFRMQPMQPGRHTPQLFHPAGQTKACTQCGATKTPQWREGPDGPKTLCNACGVKLCRQRRVAQEGKRKPATSSGTAPTPKQAASRQLQRTAEIYKQGSEDYEREVSASRPKRKAAKRAASKTAEFAASGAWPTDGMSDSPPLHGARDSGWASADQYSGSPEEVQWHSGQGFQAGAAGAELPASMGAPPPSPAVATEIGETAAAAVNLLCMSVRRDQGDAQLPTLPKRHLKASGDFTAHVNQAGKPAATEGPRVPSRMDAFRRSLQELPADQQLDLVVIKNDVDTSLREAHAAEAAVGAVAQVLAMKQAAAMNARTAHMQALKRMRDFMTSIEPQQEMMQPAGKVRRVSP